MKIRLIRTLSIAFVSFVAIEMLLSILVPGIAPLAFAAGGNAQFSSVLLAILVLIISAKIGGDIAIRFRQPEVLGELVVGVFLGNIALFFQLEYFSGLLSGTFLEFIPAGLLHFSSLVGGFSHDRVVESLSELGVILLLFEVGLETNISDLTKVGFSSFLVAIIGIVCPFFIGWLIAYFFIPDASILAHIFIGTTLCATSVGITARVLKEMGKLQAKESQIILGAAVIDDVLGLLVLAVVTSLIDSKNKGESFDVMSLMETIIIAVGFLVLAAFLGRLLAPRCFRLASMLRSNGILLSTSLALCFGFSVLASMAGLAPIIGAFAAGLILDPVSYREIADKEKVHRIEDLIKPLGLLLIPLFFVMMGLKVDVSQFLSWNVMFFAVALSIAAFIGKQVCSFGVLEKELDKITVGIGNGPAWRGRTYFREYRLRSLSCG